MLVVPELEKEVELLWEIRDMRKVCIQATLFKYHGLPYEAGEKTTILFSPWKRKESPSLAAILSFSVSVSEQKVLNLCIPLKPTSSIQFAASLLS
jgi:hypothetical protein